MKAVRWSEEQLSTFNTKKGANPPTIAPAAPAARGNSDDTLGRLPAGQMNKTETRYAQDLEYQKLAGEIRWYRFDCISLRLANRTHYKPDFLVQMADKSLQVHEVKGRWRDDARVKIKVAASMYPIYQFIAAQPMKGGGWKFEKF